MALGVASPALASSAPSAEGTSASVAELRSSSARSLIAGWIGAGSGRSLIDTTGPQASFGAQLTQGTTPSSTNPKVTERGLWNVFRTCGRDDQQGRLWADLGLGKLKDAKIAIVHDKTSYGQGLADAAKGYMNAGGKKEVLYGGVNTGEKDYSAIVAKIKASGAEYLMWGGGWTEGGLIVRQMRDEGVKAVMISGDGITGSEFAAIGGPGVEGTLMSFVPEPRNNPAAKEILVEFKASGYEPEGYTLYSYAAMQILKQAAENANSLDAKKMAEVIHSGMTFKTVIGDISYDQKGDRTDLDFVWYVWKKGPDGRITFAQE
jgi:branched-chain amino acid transport system substrate-binding protein